MEGISASSGLSVLAYANKQPELALQLLQKSLEGTASSQNMQSPTPSPAPASSTNTATTGRIIDIRA
ncbi:MAG: hypothetical protein KJ846_04695 [Proteobacteria bacterium]|nr:hypothetical protein [Pseudomonadota bacterium]MBU1986509.1 hypothetical protein [Pseudomonadota bacterium]